MITRHLISENKMLKKSFKLNTSNQGKLKEFQILFGKHEIKLESTHFDLKEIQADPLTVVAHKASQMEDYVLVDDTVLDIEGVDAGIHIKWFLEHLHSCIGHEASWKVFLAYRKGEEVFVYKGQVEGIIVEASGEGGFGFDPFFLPNGSEHTLAQSKPDDVNARALAVEALISECPFAKLKVIDKWEGEWQKY